LTDDNCRERRTRRSRKGGPGGKGFARSPPRSSERRQERRDLDERFGRAEQPERPPKHDAVEEMATSFPGCDLQRNRRAQFLDVGMRRLCTESKRRQQIGADVEAEDL
jgi:hypothetical protein